MVANGVRYNQSTLIYPTSYYPGESVDGECLRVALEGAYMYHQQRYLLHTQTYYNAAKISTTTNEPYLTSYIPEGTTWTTIAQAYLPRSPEDMASVSFDAYGSVMPSQSGIASLRIRYYDATGSSWTTGGASTMTYEARDQRERMEEAGFSEMSSHEMARWLNDSANTVDDPLGFRLGGTLSYSVLDRTDIANIQVQMKTSNSNDRIFPSLCTIYGEVQT